MKVPIKPKQLTKIKRMWRYIILHDVSCNFQGLTEFYTDGPLFQAGRLRSADYIMNGSADINFHFVLEKVNDDFEVSIGRPFTALCDYEDIPENINRISLHIGMMGSFNYKIPTDRLYQQLAYKIVTPMMQLYGIPRGRIFTHDELSTDDEIECPGKLFDKEKLLAFTQQMNIPT